jgi:hypothetical protein
MDPIAKHSIPEPNSGCWLWTGYVDRKGYAGVGYKGRRRRAHPVAYEIAKGPIPDGLEIDHLCRTRCCVNPDHLEAVTHAENIARADYSGRPRRANLFCLAKTHCPAGHPYEGENLHIDAKGARVCRECQRKSNREGAASRRADNREKYNAYMRAYNARRRSFRT